MKKTTLSLAIALGLSAVTGAASAYEAGDMILRAGLTTVNPNDSSSSVNVATVGDLGMGVEVDSNTQIGLTFVYMLDSQWGVEVLAATPFTHDVTLVDTTDNELGLGDGKLAEVTHLPPTVSALYYFNDASEAFQPYVGVGLNYTLFFDEDFSDDRTAQSFEDLELDGSFGLAFQAGFDYQLDDKWMINASVRHIDIDTTAEFTVLDLKGSVDVDIDPIVYSLMVGYKF